MQRPLDMKEDDRRDRMRCLRAFKIRPTFPAMLLFLVAGDVSEWRWNGDQKWGSGWDGEHRLQLVAHVLGEHVIRVCLCALLRPLWK